MSTIQSVHMLPAKRPANYLPTPTIIYTSSIFLVFDSSQYTDLVDDPIWHPSSLLIVSAVELKCSSMVMAPPVVITHISDIVDGVVRTIDRRHKYELFNLGKGEGTSLKKFIGLVQKHVGKKAIIKVMPDQPGDVPYTCADVNKAYE